jgi:hypothetical protein
MLELQKFFKDGGTIESLEEKYHIKATRHSKYASLVLFKYNQIESDFSQKIVCESRGIILSEYSDWKIISRPFDKFFNAEEGFAQSINWQDCLVQEKLDGSLATLYVYDGQWHVATSGTPDASGQVNGFGFSFADLFWKTFDSYNQELPSTDCKMCFMFELMTPHNMQVVKHPEPKLTLIGARDLSNQKEYHAGEAQKFFSKIPVVQEFPINSLEEIKQSFEKMDPTKQEGFVVLNKKHNSFGSFNRIKVKSPAYVSLHHMRDGLNSQKNIVNVVRLGEISEIIAHFPEYSEMLYEVKFKYDLLVHELEKEYNDLKDCETQKEFAVQAVLSRCSSALFALHAKKTSSIKEFLKDYKIDSLMRILGYK